MADKHIDLTGLKHYTEKILEKIGEAEESAKSAATASINDAKTELTTEINKKATANNITASSSGYKFPTWNSQGVITGSVSTAQQKSYNINGTSGKVYGTSTTAMPTVYAPTTAGTSGYVLKSSGSGAPSWVAQSTLSVGSATNATNATNATKATQDSDGNTINTTYSKVGHTHDYLPLAGGNISGHVYFSGASASSSTGNTSQIVFGTSSNNHVAISSNDNAIVINPTTSSTTNQIVLYLDKQSQFPSGITSSGIINATTLSEGGVTLTNKYAPKSHTHTVSNISDGSRILSTLIPYGTAVTASSDLNTVTYIKVGNYYCSANATVATLTNCPTSAAFMMQVYSPLATSYDNESTGTWVYRLRKLMTYTGDEFIQQVYSNGTAGDFTYGAWKKIATSADITATETNISTKADLTNSSQHITTGTLTVSTINLLV